MKIKHLPFPPLFVEKLIGLPKDQRIPLVKSLHHKLDDATTELKQLEEDVNYCCAEYDSLVNRSSTSDASDASSTPDSERSSSRQKNLKSDDALKRQLSNIADVVNKIGSRLDRLFSCVEDKSLANSAYPLINKLWNFSQTTFTASQESLQKMREEVVDEMALAILGTKEGGAQTEPKADSVSYFITDLNKKRRKALQAFNNLQCLVNCPDAEESNASDHSYSDQTLQESMQQAGMTEEHARLLRSLYQRQTQEVRPMIQLGNTRDEIIIPPLVSVLGKYPQAIEKFIKELIKRTSIKTDTLPLEASQRETLDTLTPAYNESPEALGNALIQLGDKALMDLLYVHLLDKKATYRITSDIPLQELLIGLAKAAHQNSQAQTVLSEILEKWIVDSENPSETINTLKTVKQILKEHKTNNKSTPITLRLPWSIYHPRVIYNGLGISTFTASCIATAIIGVGVGQVLPEEFTSLANVTVISSLSLLGAKIAYQFRSKIPAYHTLIGRDHNVITKTEEDTGHDEQVKAPVVLQESPIAEPVTHNNVPAEAPVMEDAHHDTKTNNHSADKSVVDVTSNTQLELHMEHIQSTTTHSLQRDNTMVDTPVTNEPAVSSFRRATMPTVFDIIRPDDTDSYAYKAHKGIETIFSPISNLFRICNDTLEGFLGSTEDSALMMSHLCNQWGLDQTHIAKSSAMLSHLEALFNWGGRIPYVCTITGLWRVTTGLVMTVASSALGLWTIAFAKDEKSSLAGRVILKQCAIKQGVGNIVRGIIESSSWAGSILTHLPRDLLGIRWSYAGEETASKLHLTPMLKNLTHNIQKRLGSTG